MTVFVSIVDLSDFGIKLFICQIAFQSRNLLQEMKKQKKIDLHEL